MKRMRGMTFTDMGLTIVIIGIVLSLLLTFINVPPHLSVNVNSDKPMASEVDVSDYKNPLPRNVSIYEFINGNNEYCTMTMLRSYSNSVALSCNPKTQVKK